MNLPLSGHVHFVQSEEAHRTVLQGQSTGVISAEVDACNMCKLIDLMQERKLQQNLFLQGSFFVCSYCICIELCFFSNRKLVSLGK